MKRIFILMLMCFPVMADGLHIGAWSHHLTSKSYFDLDGNKRSNNESHQRLGYYYDLSDKWVEVGRFKNSYRVNSLYLGFGKNYYRSKHLDFGVVGGYITGYRKTRTYAAATASAKSESLTIDLSFTGEVVIASFRIEL